MNKTYYTCLWSFRKMYQYYIGGANIFLELQSNFEAKLSNCPKSPSVLIVFNQFSVSQMSVSALSGFKNLGFVSLIFTRHVCERWHGHGAFWLPQKKKKKVLAAHLAGKGNKITEEFGIYKFTVRQIVNKWLLPSTGVVSQQRPLQKQEAW